MTKVMEGWEEFVMESHSSAQGHGCGARCKAPICDTLLVLSQNIVWGWIFPLELP